MENFIFCAVLLTYFTWEKPISLVFLGSWNGMKFETYTGNTDEEINLGPWLYIMH